MVKHSDCKYHCLLDICTYIVLQEIHFSIAMSKYQLFIRVVPITSFCIASAKPGAHGLRSEGKTPRPSFSLSPWGVILRVGEWKGPHILFSFYWRIVCMANLHRFYYHELKWQKGSNQQTSDWKSKNGDWICKHEGLINKYSLPNLQG